MGPDQVARLLRQSILTSMVSSTAPDSSDVASSLEGSSHFTQDTHSISSGPHSISPTVASTITCAVFPLRLVVARAAVGHPADLAAILAQQEELIKNQRFIGPSCIIPSGALDESLDHLIRLMLPVSELEALCAFQSEELCDEQSAQNFSATGGLESTDATESLSTQPMADTMMNDLVETEPPTCTSPPLLDDQRRTSAATNLQVRFPFRLHIHLHFRNRFLFGKGSLMTGTESRLHNWFACSLETGTGEPFVLTMCSLSRIRCSVDSRHTKLAL
ncbi:unnamed protein product [Dibothriocephalus latus]|uniref:Uncharacterized protein n=1 Tax=Dibothriocephalus latus TaxID=60516 RepID=A0A3P7NTV4_DIBLA|nr:unnamed protein product [Dibothriocephalus latus]